MRSGVVCDIQQNLRCEMNKQDVLDFLMQGWRKSLPDPFESKPSNLETELAQTLTRAEAFILSIHNWNCSFIFVWFETLGHMMTI